MCRLSGHLYSCYYFIIICVLQGAEVGSLRQSEMEERQRIMELVQLQGQEIDTLKEEILMLSRKGGHVMPPSQPPLPRLNSRGTTTTSAHQQHPYSSA